MSWFEHKINAGEAMQVGDMEITPLARMMKIQLPGKHVGLIWNRPQAVVVKTPDGQESTLPVIDVTRVTVWAILGAGVLGALIIGVLLRNK